MKDFKLTNEGEFVIGPDGDLATVEGDEALAQAVVFRLKTTKGDWTLDPSCGADLEQFIGAPNTRVTRDVIEQAVASELLRGGLVPAPTVSCVQLSEEEVFILVEFPSIEESGRTVRVSSSLDLRTGKVFSRVQ